MKAYKGTGTLQLNTYNSLKNKNIYYTAVVVKNTKEAENSFQETYPNFLKTLKKED